MRKPVGKTVLAMARYELRDGTTGEVLSRHLTRSGAMDVWRLRHPERPVRLVRIRAGGVEAPVIEGVWHGTRRRARDRAAEPTLPAGTEAVDDRPGTLRELLDLIVQTTRSDWHVVPRFDDPRPSTAFISGTQPSEAQPAAHEVLHRAAVLRWDPETALAWDFDLEPDRGAVVPALVGRRARSRTVEVRLHGSAVHRGTYLDVDRGTVYLPTPVREAPTGTFEMRAWDNKLVALLNELAGMTEYDAFCARLGLVEIPGHPLD